LRETSWRLSLAPDRDPATLATWDALRWLLCEATTADNRLPRTACAQSGGSDSYAAVQQQADALARQAAAQTFSRQQADRFLRQLVELDSSFVAPDAPPREVLFKRALRLTLALERLSSAGDGAPPSSELNALRQHVSSVASFDPTQFAGALRQARDARR
jgi:hypothetical protein